MPHQKGIKYGGEERRGEEKGREVRRGEERTGEENNLVLSFFFNSRKHNPFHHIAVKCACLDKAPV